MADAPGHGELYVEANDDEATIRALCGLPHSPFTVDRPGGRWRICFGGHECFRTRQDPSSPSRESALEMFEAAVETQLVPRIGLMVDADNDLRGAWQRVRDILSDNEYQPPGDPDPAGTVIVPAVPQLKIVGVWFMPDNRLNGKLEDFISLLVPAEQERLWRHAGESIGQIPDGHRHFKESDCVKAHVHTYLAWQDEPGRPIGQSITRTYLDGPHQHAQRFVDWLKRLFIDEGPAS